MFRFAADLLQRVRQQIDYRFERLDGTRRTTRQIQNQAGSADTAHGAAQRCVRSLARSLQAHLFGNSFDQTVAHGTCRFRRDVSGSDASAASGNNESSRPAQFDQFFLDRGAFVGDYAAQQHLKIAPHQRFDYGWTGEIHSVATRTGIADCQNRRCRFICGQVIYGRSIRCRGGHLHPQTRRRAVPRPVAAILPSRGPAYSASLFPATTCH